MNDINDSSVELIVTSPPYPMIEMWDSSFVDADERVGVALRDHNGAEAFELMHRYLDQVWRECARVVRPGGFVCINIGDATRKLGENFRLYTNHSRITVALEQLGLQSLPAILWRKQTNAPNKFMGSGMLPSGAYVTLEHEYILIFRKGDKRVMKRDEAATRRRSAFFWEERNVWFSDIWDFKGVKQPLTGVGARERSAAYPFELAYRLINMYSMQGDTVLDPFLGTGTTSAAALVLARNSVGYEIDSDLRNAIDETIAQAAARADAMVQERFRRHMEFIQSREEAGNPPAHTNVVYGFPVVTRQEVELELMTVDQIDSTGASGFRAKHSMIRPAQPERSGEVRTQEQLALKFSE
ncbi:MAG: DNA-methyltransferase [Spirochaetota bacterium]